MPTTIVLALDHIACYKCGVVFGIESGHHQRLVESHESFYCPNGHSQAFIAQTEKERRIAELEREARSAKASRDFWAEQSKSANKEVEHKTRQVNGYRGVVTRMKRRTVQGRCPCCAAQFKDLKRHMTARHPDWNPDREAVARQKLPTTGDPTNDG
jgi:Zn finger protein HypA/HybF involved in hydrogenase expression